MVIQSTEVTKDHVIVVLNELKVIKGQLILQRRYTPTPNSLEAYLIDASGQRHPISSEILHSVKPEIRSWLDRVLSREIQDFASQLGAHVRGTREQDDALLLLSLYREIN